MIFLIICFYFIAFLCLLSVATSGNNIGLIFATLLTIISTILLIKKIIMKRKEEIEKQEKIKNEKILQRKKEETNLLKQELEIENIKKQIIETKTICNYCGSILENNKCPNCGAKNKN